MISLPEAMARRMRDPVPSLGTVKERFITALGARPPPSPFDNTPEKPHTLTRVAPKFSDDRISKNSASPAIKVPSLARSRWRRVVIRGFQLPAFTASQPGEAPASRTNPSVAMMAAASGPLRTSPICRGLCGGRPARTAVSPSASALQRRRGRARTRRARGSRLQARPARGLTEPTNRPTRDSDPPKSATCAPHFRMVRRSMFGKLCIYSGLQLRGRECVG